MEGIQLAGDGRAAQILQRSGGGVGAVLAHHHDQLVGAVRIAEVQRSLALLGGAHARDDRIERAAHHAHGQAVPLGLDDDQLLAQPLGDALGNLHVVAVGVTAAALNGHGVLAGLGLRPVVGRVVALHAHAEGALRGRDRTGEQREGCQDERENLFHGDLSSSSVCDKMKKAATALRHCCFDPQNGKKTCE